VVAPPRAGGGPAAGSPLTPLRALGPGRAGAEAAGIPPGPRLCPRFEVGAPRLFRLELCLVVPAGPLFKFQLDWGPPVRNSARRRDLSFQLEIGQRAVGFVPRLDNNANFAFPILSREHQPIGLQSAHRPTDDLFPELQVDLTTGPLLVPTLLLARLSPRVAGERGRSAKAILPGREDRESLVERPRALDVHLGQRR